MDAWQARYRRAVLDFLEAPAEVDLETVEISTSYDEGYRYSEYTGADPRMTMSVFWIAPNDVDPRYEWGLRIRKGERVWRTLENDDIAKLINSF